MSGVAVWLRPVGSRIAHAFLAVAVEMGRRHDVSVVAVRLCGTWPVTELEPDELAERCGPCERAVDELERGSP